MKRKDKAWYALFVAPLFIVFALVVLVPFFIGIGYSFVSWDGMPLNEKVFVGFKNYTKLFTDARFKISAINTLKFTVISVMLINVLGLLFALVATSRLKIRNLIRTMLFMPYLIGGLILGYIWKFIFTDLFNMLGQATGLDSVFFNWLIDPKYALIALVIVNA